MTPRWGWSIWSYDVIRNTANAGGGFVWQHSFKAGRKICIALKQESSKRSSNLIAFWLVLIELLSQWLQLQRDVVDGASTSGCVWWWICVLRFGFALDALSAEDLLDEHVQYYVSYGMSHHALKVSWIFWKSTYDVLYGRLSDAKSHQRNEQLTAHLTTTTSSPWHSRFSTQ